MKLTMASWLGYVFTSWYDDCCTYRKPSIILRKHQLEFSASKILCGIQEISKLTLTLTKYIYINKIQEIDNL